MSEQLRIAVLGAGYLGSALARAAADAAHAVWAVRRSPNVGADDGVTWIKEDIAHVPLESLPSKLDVIVLTIAPSLGGSYVGTYPPSARAAVDLAKRTAARALLYTSSTGVYGARGGVWVTERSDRAGKGETNAALIAAEDIILAGAVVAPTVLRVAGIYGPDRDPRARMGASDQLAQRGEYWVNLAHRDDIVSAILHVSTLPHAPRVLNVSDGSPTRAREVARWLASASGYNPDALVFCNDAQRSRNDQRVSNAALTATGWAPRYKDFAAGFSYGL